MSVPTISVEQVMSVAVEAIHGEVLSKRFGPSPGFENADYYFPADHIVAELKLLSEDLFSKPGFQDRFNAMLRSWVSNGHFGSPESAVQAVESGRCPIACHRELFNFLRSRLESSCLKKANEQIKQTKTHIPDHDALGVLIIANDGNTFFSPRLLLDVCSASLRKHRRSIESAIFLAPNLHVTAPGGLMPHAPWMDFYLHDRRIVPKEFSYRLFDAWCRAHCDSLPAIDVVAGHMQLTRAEFENLGYVPVKLYPPLKEGFRA